jgi:hypothetical protein
LEAAVLEASDASAAIAADARAPNGSLMTSLGVMYNLLSEGAITSDFRLRSDDTPSFFSFCILPSFPPGFKESIADQYAD